MVNLTFWCKYFTYLFWMVTTSWTYSMPIWEYNLESDKTRRNCPKVALLYRDTEIQKIRLRKQKCMNIQLAEIWNIWVESWFLKLLWISVKIVINRISFFLSLIANQLVEAGTAYKLTVFFCFKLDNSLITSIVKFRFFYF